MRGRWLLVTMLLVILAPSSLAGDRRNGIGIGYAGSTIDMDVEGLDGTTFRGFTVFGKVGLTDHWGIAASYRDMEDVEDLPFGEEDSYRQLGLFGVRMFRPKKEARPHLKVGLAWFEAEAAVPAQTISDSSIGLSVGFGLEWGSQRLAFFLDVEFTGVSVELLSGSDRELLVGNTTLGFIYKF